MLAKTVPTSVEPAPRLHPCGPVLLRTRPAEARPVRIRASLMCAACVALIATAARLEPDARGLGTHTQLGVPACSWPSIWGIPCPTCGMTTAFAWTVRGHWLAAVRVQPLGWLAAVTVLSGAALAVAALWTGRTWRINWYRVSPGYACLAVLLLALAAWGYKILVMSGRFG